MVSTEVVVMVAAEVVVMVVVIIEIFVVEMCVNVVDVATMAQPLRYYPLYTCDQYQKNTQTHNWDSRNWLSKMVPNYGIMLLEPLQKMYFS